jgi:hypothetical protein
MKGQSQSPANEGPAWQSTLVAVAFIALVAAIFLSVFFHAGIDSALKAWAAIGTLVGVLTGAIPTYFFGQASVRAERQERQRTESRLRSLMGEAPPDFVREFQERHPEIP